jgi:hypothetical protein
VTVLPEILEDARALNLSAKSPQGLLNVFPFADLYLSQ